MRKNLLLALVAASLVALGSGPVASAGGSCCQGGSSLTIVRSAHLDQFFPGFTGVDIYVDIRCTDPTRLGTVDVTVTQGASQSSNGLGATGTGSSTANCDGTSRRLMVHVGGDGMFNIGCAGVLATLNAYSGNVSKGDTVDIAS